jgi:hypothetical protein
MPPVAGYDEREKAITDIEDVLYPVAVIFAENIGVNVPTAFADGLRWEYTEAGIMAVVNPQHN